MRAACAVVLFAVAVTVRMAAQEPHPDFSGSWIVDSVASAGDQRERPEGHSGGFGRGGGGRGFGRSGRGGEGHSGEGRARGPAADQPRLERGERVEMTQTEALLTVIVAPDAGGRVVRYPLDGTDGFTAAPDGTALRTKTSWQGVALVTEARAADKGGEYHERQVRTMDASGHVTIETTRDTPFGKRTVTVTLTRRES
jgi:hypothetical protein